MPGDAIVPYVSGGVDVSQEMERLGYAVIVRMWRHWTEIVAGKRDFRSMQSFASYGGIPIYLAQIGDAFAFYAVETEADDAIKVSVLLAAKESDMAVSASPGTGSHSNILRQAVLLRAADYFELRA